MEAMRGLAWALRRSWEAHPGSKGRICRSRNGKRSPPHNALGCVLLLTAAEKLARRRHRRNPTSHSVAVAAASLGLAAAAVREWPLQEATVGKEEEAVIDRAVAEMEKGECPGSPGTMASASRHCAKRGRRPTPSSIWAADALLRCGGVSKGVALLVAGAIVELCG